MAAVAVVATATASVVDTDVGGVDENSTEAVDNVTLSSMLTTADTLLRMEEKPS